MPSYLISSVRIFDGRSITHELGYIFVCDGVIHSASASRPESLPAGCIEISGEGCTILPGLIDGHVHVYNQIYGLEESLSYGVTTVLDLHNETYWANNAKKTARERNDVADILSSYNSATIPSGWPREVFLSLDPSEENRRRVEAWPPASTIEEAKQFVSDRVAQGADFIKLMQETGAGFGLIPKNQPLPTPSVAIQRTLVDAAHNHGILAVAHAMSHSDTLAVLEAGVDGVVHSIMDKSPTPELLEAFKNSGAFMVPTLTVTASNTGSESESREYFAHGLEGDKKEHMRCCTRYAREESNVQAGYEQTRALREAGVDIVCGTDVSPNFAGLHFGLSMHHEMWLYVHRCGFSPTEALASATSVSARRWRLADRGIIEVGKNADLLLVRGDPTDDINATRNIVGVWRNGVRLEATLTNGVKS
ncbi:hypothetical protein K431DRAFT_241501 [Polychaeton citri CBS 116435]|uniref:Amidohydrolase-related domain-containing protein n=1 Tax=Polychaeton citri CBS 116435 TaxID=1314669 RepID=A0A9P4QEX7_9PEZI|nr:hypothetical protein K431DRAFT_241501 [Polychaeton citri CBS 116435]